MCRFIVEYIRAYQTECCCVYGKRIKMEFSYSVFLLLCLLPETRSLTLGTTESCGIIGKEFTLVCNFSGESWNPSSTRDWRGPPSLTLLFSGGIIQPGINGYVESVDSVNTDSAFRLHIQSLSWSDVDVPYQCSYRFDVKRFSINRSIVEDYNTTHDVKTYTKGKNILATINLDAVTPVPTATALLHSPSGTSDVTSQAITITSTPNANNAALNTVNITVNYTVTDTDHNITVNLATPCGYTKSYTFKQDAETTTITNVETTTTSQMTTELFTTSTEPQTSPKRETTDSVTSTTEAKTTRSYSETTTKPLTSNLPEGGQTTIKSTTTLEAESSSSSTNTVYTSTTKPSGSPLAGEEIIIITVCSVVGFIIILFIVIIVMFTMYKRRKTPIEKHHKQEHTNKFHKQQEKKDKPVKTFDDFHALENRNKYERENERHISYFKYSNKRKKTTSSYQHPRGYDHNKYNNRNTISTYYPRMYGGSHNYGFDWETSPYEQNYQYYTGSTPGSSYYDQQKHQEKCLGGHHHRSLGGHHHGRSSERHHGRSGERHHGRYQRTHYQSYPAASYHYFPNDQY